MWYEIYRFESQSKRFGCATMLFVLNDDNANGYKVYSSYTTLRTKQRINFEGTAEWSIENDPTKLAIFDIQYPKKSMFLVSSKKNIDGEGVYQFILTKEQLIYRKRESITVEFVQHFNRLTPKREILSLALSSLISL